ncbi:MAG: hypothetical protein PHI12_06785 [Dehalococcoidales bacterium]|nr:hypothetical protein [Dehalococcoidales bacterium]
MIYSWKDNPIGTSDPEPEPEPELRKQGYQIGERIRVIGGDLFLGRWIPAGTKGTIVGLQESVFSTYHVRLDDDGRIYPIAPAEMEKIENEQN